MLSRCSRFFCEDRLVFTRQTTDKELKWTGTISKSKMKENGITMTLPDALFALGVRLVFATKFKCIQFCR